MDKFIEKLPKAELHIHLDGAIRPEMVLLFAERNKVKLPFSSIEEIHKLYNFKNLAEFLDLYFMVNEVINTEQDFYDLAMDYLKIAASQGVKYAEICFEVQSFYERGITFDVIFNGIISAFCDAAEQYNIQANPILCFLRHYSEEDAFHALKQSWNYRDKIIAVGLAGYEINNPPSKFIKVMKEAKSYGYNITVHAGEEVGPLYIWQSIELLKAQRIDHGISCIQDPMLIEYMISNNIAVTLCPLSNLALKRVDSLENHPLKTMLNLGMRVSINSDDPGYFNSYISDNYIKVAKALNLTKEDIVVIARNSFLSSFANDLVRASYITQLNEYLKQSV